jgi:uncharacterized membrane protein YebE (DUF533 family)
MSLDRVLSRLLANPGAAGLAGATAAGLLTTKTGRKLGRSALQLGGAAALAGLAYTAWQRYQAAQQPAGASSAPEPTPVRLVEAGFLPAPREAGASDELARALLRAMLAAARADGKLDGAERSALFERIASLDLDDASRAELYAELERPVSIDEVVGFATTRERALELYSASLAAIDADTPAERGYLSLLAARLGLDDALVETIHREATAPTAPAL